MVAVLSKSKWLIREAMKEVAVDFNSLTISGEMIDEAILKAARFFPTQTITKEMISIAMEDVVEKRMTSFIGASMNGAGPSSIPSCLRHEYVYYSIVNPGDEALYADIERRLPTG